MKRLVLVLLLAGACAPIPPPKPPTPPLPTYRAVSTVVQDENGAPVSGAVATLDDSAICGGAHTATANDDGYVLWPSVCATLRATHLTAQAEGFVSVSEHRDLQTSVNEVLAPITVKWDHVDPMRFSLDELKAKAFRSALIITLNVPFGPRPNQDDNVASTNGGWNYTEADQLRVVAAYRERGYTGAPVGPFIDPGYHGKIGGIDFRKPDDLQLAQDVIQRMWDGGLIPSCWITPDGWTVEQLKTLEPILRTPWWQAHCRVVVNGFEQQGEKYGWANTTYVAHLTWLRDVFPNAIRGLHTIADVEAPVGQGDETDYDRCTQAQRDALKCFHGNGGAWTTVTPLVHAWLHQSNALFTPTHVDPTGDGRTDEAHWLDLWDKTKSGSFIRRFKNGESGWPTTSANGGPLLVIAGEYWSYYMYWQNWPESKGRDYGAQALKLGADGYYDGGRH